MQPNRARSRWWVVGAMSAASIVLTIDLFGVNVALPEIARDLDLSDDTLQWIPSIYFLALAAPLVAAGRVGDLLGRRRTLVAGALVCALGSLLAAVATDGAVMLLGRAVSGIGAAFVTALSLTLVSEAFPPERRGLAIGIWSGVGALGAAAGPLVAGLVTEGLGWRWLFAIDVPIAVGAVVITVLTVTESRDPEAHGIDLLGVLLVTLGFGLVSYGLLAGPERSWTRASVVVTVVLGVTALVAFVRVELRRREPLLDLRWLSRPPALGAGLVAFAGNAAFAVVMLYLTLYFQGVRGDGPIATGVAFLTFTIPLGLASPFAGSLLRRVRGERAMAAGMLVLAAGAGALALLRHDSPVWIAGVGLALSGLGQAVVFNVTNIVEVDAVPSRQTGMAAGVVSGVRQLGSLAGLAAASVVFAAAGGTTLVVPAAGVAGAATGFDDGLRAVMVTLTALCVLGAAASTWSRSATPVSAPSGA